MCYRSAGAMAYSILVFFILHSTLWNEYSGHFNAAALQQTTIHSNALTCEGSRNQQKLRDLRSEEAVHVNKWVSATLYT